VFLKGSGRTKESKVKNGAPEVQSAPEVMTSSEAKFIRSASSEATSPEAEKLNAGISFYLV